MLKDKMQSLKVRLQSMVKPKVFWPSVIILLALCITLYTFKEKEKSLRIATQVQLSKTITEKKVVENNLVEAKEEIVVKDKEIATRDEQIKLILDKLEKETIARKEAEVQLIVVIKEKTAMEEQVAGLAAALPKTIELENIVVKAIRELTGRVLSFDKENTFVVIDLGSRDDLKLGDILSVYRDDKFIGKVQVEKVREETSAAAILTPWRNVEYKESDEVRKL